MNVAFKVVRRAGDKVYVLCEITGYDERLPVVLSAATEEGARIPSDSFPYCDPSDPAGVSDVLSDGALATRADGHPLLHTHNSAEVRFFVIVLPWMDIRRWILEFRAMDSSGIVVESCVKRIDLTSAVWLDRLNSATNQQRGDAIESLDGRFIHDRIHVSFLRAIEDVEGVLVTALIEMPYHEDSVLEIDFLDGSGHARTVESHIIEDSIDDMVDYGSFERRYVMLTFRVDRANPGVCLCATDTVGQVAPGFAMLGAASLFSLLSDTSDATTDAFEDADYDLWFKSVHQADFPTLLEQVSTRFDYEPLISFVCPVYSSPIHHVHDLMNSMLTQSYGRWELILVDEADHPNAALANLLSSVDDDRIFVVSVEEGRSHAALVNHGVYAAEGEFVGFIRSSDVMAPDTLFEFVRMINEYPDCDFIYCDSDTFNAEGLHTRPVFRPSFSPELLRSTDYIDDLMAIRSDVLERIGAIDSAIPGALGYDLVLRATEVARRVCHVPRVLCHRRFATRGLGSSFLDAREIQEAGRRALVEHCRRVGITAEVMSLAHPRHYRVRHVLNRTPLVSIIVPTADNPERLLQCLRSIETKIHYRNYEIIVLDGGSCEEGTWQAYEDMKGRFANLRVVTVEDASNRARFLNIAAEQAEGEFLLFVNDDVRVLTNDALEGMLGYFQSDDVAVVGPKRLFVDGTVEHAGLLVGGDDVVTPQFRFMPKDWSGYLSRNVLAQNVTAVAGDCMMVRRSAFEEVGGFTEEFAMFFSHVDFCLKVRNAGYLTVFTPHVCLSHFRSVSRVHAYSKSLRLQRRREAALLQFHWPRVFVEGDEFHNPNLDPNGAYYSLRW